MIETITIITLSLILLSLVRPGKTPPLDNPLVIERPGQYRMTLAPQLNLAQPFIEAIVSQLGSDSPSRPDSSILCFRVQDKEVAAHGHDHYLLAVAQRSGMLYFQAAAPASADMPGLAADVLADIPAPNCADTATAQLISAAVQSVAEQRKIMVLPMPADNKSR